MNEIKRRALQISGISNNNVLMQSLALESDWFSCSAQFFINQLTKDLISLAYSYFCSSSFSFFHEREKEEKNIISVSGYSSTNFNSLSRGNGNI